ncbi:MAG: hypothetical protein AABW54_03930 [Candidatus Micrarchaeota archaeon]
MAKIILVVGEHPEETPARKRAKMLAKMLVAKGHAVEIVPSGKPNVQRLVAALRRAKSPEERRKVMNELGPKSVDDAAWLTVPRVDLLKSRPYSHVFDLHNMPVSEQDTCKARCAIIDPHAYPSMPHGCSSYLDYWLVDGRGRRSVVGLVELSDLCGKHIEHHRSGRRSVVGLVELGADEKPAGRMSARARKIIRSRHDFCMTALADYYAPGKILLPLRLSVVAHSLNRLLRTYDTSPSNRFMQPEHTQAVANAIHKLVTAAEGRAPKR